MFNQIKTVLLLGILTSILLVIGYLIGGTSGLTIAFAFAIIMNVGSFWFSDKIVLRMYHAQPLEKAKAPKIHSMVEEIAKKADIPIPRIYLIPSENLNAFCTGPSPKKTAIAFTHGIIKTLTPRELKGVAAHELAHAKNRDTLISTIAATIASVIAYVAFMARFAAIFGGGRDSQGAGNILQLLVLAIVAPITATLIQLAISRSREYLADETGSKLTKDPDALADALLKLESNNKSHPMRFGTPQSAHLFITNPFSSGAFIGMFQTHPPIPARVERLRKMKS
jgi:heat shock protein HtpX